MLIVREIFTAKPGMASKLAKLFKKVFGHDSKVKIMTDLVGPYNTVVVEMQVESLAEFEKHMQDHKSGKSDPNTNPEVAEEMSKYTDMFIEGKREIFQILE